MIDVTISVAVPALHAGPLAESVRSRNIKAGRQRRA